MPLGPSITQSAQPVLLVDAESSTGGLELYEENPVPDEDEIGEPGAVTGHRGAPTVHGASGTEVSRLPLEEPSQFDDGRLEIRLGHHGYGDDHQHDTLIAWSELRIVFAHRLRGERKRTAAARTLAKGFSVYPP
jgi:hypothetical protein